MQCLYKLCCCPKSPKKQSYEEVRKEPNEPKEEPLTVHAEDQDCVDCVDSASVFEGFQSIRNMLSSWSLPKHKEVMQFNNIRKFDEFLEESVPDIDDQDVVSASSNLSELFE